jgi:hypothetical protein
MVRQDVLYPVYFGRRPGGNLAQSINIRLHTLAFLLRPLLLQGSDVESAVHWVAPSGPPFKATKLENCCPLDWDVRLPCIIGLLRARRLTVVAAQVSGHLVSAYESRHLYTAGGKDVRALAWEKLKEYGFRIARIKLSGP